MRNIYRFRIHRLVLTLALLASSIGCDQATKHVLRDSLPVTGPLTYLNDGVRLQYAENSGSFLSFGADLPESLRFWFFNVGVSLFLIALTWVVLTAKKPRLSSLIGLTLVLAGR